MTEQLTQPNQILNPPAFLTREEACCLKTALALIVVKRRFAERHGRSNTQETRHEGHSPNEYSFQHWLVPNDRLALCSSVLPVPAQAKAHLDHMTQLAGQAYGRQDTAVFGALTTHLANEIKHYVTNDPDNGRSWLQSYLLALTGTTVAIFRAVLHKAAEQKHELASVLLEMLTKLVIALLDDQAANVEMNVTKNGYYVYDLLECCFLLASETVVRQALEDLSQFTLPMDNLALSYAKYKGQHDASARLFLQMSLYELLHIVIAALSAGNLASAGINHQGIWSQE